ncbi:olfactory receptor 14K1-like [Fukomys damarensis]|uniref:olfactory receptor 14K1-like n=1 Tax=Fukomys damarensis TaxID=885580 RepID=UPI0014558441|nr:olfactory receptor 14K1-like [Fukomys damarensis]
MKNNTHLWGFLLLRLTDSTVLLGLQAALFSLVYLVSTLENLTIVLLTVLDHHLHIPMYFFLRHLSFLDLCLISTTVPKYILNCITLTDSISFWECVCQLFLVIMLTALEVGILTAMSYDRYIAICHPLHYEAVMSKRCCVRLMAVSWLSGGALGVLYSAGTFSLEFCGSIRIHQFFCDVPALLELTCSQDHAAVSVSVGLGVLYGFSCFVCILVSYVFIFSTVLKIQRVKCEYIHYSNVNIGFSNQVNITQEVQKCDGLGSSGPAEARMGSAPQPGCVEDPSSSSCSSSTFCMGFLLHNLLTLVSRGCDTEMG